MKFTHARAAGLSAVAASMLSACVMSATGSVTPGLIGASGGPSMSPGTSASASPAASKAPTASTSPSPATGASPVATTSASPTAATSASPSAPAGGKSGDVEPNNEFATASMGAWDTPTSGTAGAGDEEGDYYQLVVPAGAQDGWLVVTLSEANADYAPSIEYYKSNKATLAGTTYAESIAADPTEGKVRVKAGNTYYVKLAPHAQDETVDYTVTFKFVPVADPGERNDTFETATPLALGTMTKFATFWADDADDDKDYFKVTLPEGKTKFRVLLKNTTTNADPGTYAVAFFSGVDKASVGGSLYASSQADIAGEDALGPELAPGEYYLLVEGANTDALSELTVTAE